MGVAGYPEAHPEARSLEEDINNLRKKVEAGASFIISQMFFINSHFYDYLEKVKKIGIEVPVFAGIMPVFKASLLPKILELSNAAVPSGLTALIDKYGSDDTEMEKAGIEYAVNQISELTNNGVDGIHLYTMNRASLARKISSYSGLR